MSDKRWVVTTVTDRIALDEQKRGEAAFAVKNLGARARAVFEVKPLNGADPSWFSVENPSRTLATDASVSYVVKVGVAESAPPARYELVGRVYAADAAPEEDFAESNRVILEVKGAPPAAPKKKFPWWIVIAAAAGALVLSLVGWLVFGRGEAPATPAAPVDPVVPNLVNKTEAQAVAALRAARLKPGNIKHRYDESKVDAVAEQTLPYGAKLLPDTAIDFVVAVRPSAPILTAPANAAVVAPAADYTFTWTQTESWVKKWRVSAVVERCVPMPLVFPPIPPTCQWISQGEQIVTEPKATIKWTAVPPGMYHSGWIRWEVSVVDDFDKPATVQTGVFLMRKP